MRRSLLLAAALVLGAVLANTLLPENGYVAISFRSYLVEMSVPTLVLCVMLTLLVLESLQTVARWPNRAREARLEQRRARARTSISACSRCRPAAGASRS